MIVPVLKLGVAVGVGYTVGGSVGERVLSMITPTASIETHTGAQWAGRVVTFTLLMWALGKV